MKKENNRIYITITFTSVVLCWIFFPFIVCLFFDKWDKAGTFGDSYGALNTFFSGLAFAAICVTLKIQYDEYRKQREEFEKNTAALISQNHLLMLQTEMLRNQQFEGNFYQLLNNYREVVSSVSIFNDRGSFTEGRQCFIELATDFKQHYEVWKNSGRNEIDKITEALRPIIKHNNLAFNLFINNLRSLLMYIDISKLLTSEQKLDYVEIFSATLSNQERILAFYYCVIDKTSSLSSLAVKLKFFEKAEHIPLLDPEHSALL